jgi:hypothetical protein
MADESAVLGCRRCREMGNPGIDPTNRVRDICAVDRDFIADEKILRDIFFNPFAELMLLFNRPPPLTHFPDLKRRLLWCFTKGGYGNEHNEEED